MITGERGSEAQELRELIGAYRRRFHKLRLRVATMGIDARPEDLIEIEEIEKKLTELAEQLSRLMAIPAAEREAPARGLASQHLSISLRFWPRGGDKYEVLLHSEVSNMAGEFVLSYKARIGDKDYQLHSVKHGTVTPKPGEKYYVVEISGQGMLDVGLQKGDYAMIQQGEDAEGIGVALAEDEVLFGRFERLKDGNTRFIPSDPNTPPRIISDPDVLLTGIIVGILKPA